jgi:hypothetical protein
MSKFTTYLAYVGLFFVVLEIVSGLVIYHSAYGFKYSDTLRYMLYMGVFLQVPSWGYRLWHYKAYEEENRNRLINWALLAALVVLFMIFKG